MELNGVANLHLLVEKLEGELKEYIPYSVPYQLAMKDIKQMKKQLELLERYMIALDTLEDGEEPPYWHEVRLNPERYRTRKEMMYSQKQFLWYMLV